MGQKTPKRPPKIARNAEIAREHAIFIVYCYIKPTANTIVLVTLRAAAAIDFTIIPSSGTMRKMRLIRSNLIFFFATITELAVGDRDHPSSCGGLRKETLYFS